MLPSTHDSAVTIVQLTDMHLLAEPDGTLMGVDTAHNLRGVVRHLQENNRNPALMLATGDLTQDGSPAGYQRFLDIIAPTGLPWHALPGNHDALQAFQLAMGSHAAPVINLPAWRIVMLDSTIAGSNDGHLAASQLALLDTLASDGDPRHVLVALHHNPISLRDHTPDLDTLDNADALLQRLARMPQVRGLLWGHVHQAFDANVRLPGSERTLRMLATPATSFQFHPRSETYALDTLAPGYRWLTLHADGRIDTDVVRVPGMILPPA